MVSSEYQLFTDPKKDLTYTIHHDIKDKTGQEHLAELWDALFSKIEESGNQIVSWECSSSGAYTLKLKKPYRIWIDTPKTEGGCIFLLGDNEKTVVKGSIKANQILFKEGFKSYCQHKLIYVKPTMKGIVYDSKEEIKVGGTYMLITQWEVHSFEELHAEWTHCTEVVPDDYQGGYHAYLQKKA